MSLERKLQRKNSKNKKKLAEKELATKVALFGKLPSNCLTCERPFDKMNKQQVMTWNVVLRQEKVNLYCPECWERAKNRVEDFKKRIEERDAGSDK